MAKMLTQRNSAYSFFKEILWKFCTVFTDSLIKRFPNISADFRNLLTSLCPQPLGKGAFLR